MFLTRVPVAFRSRSGRVPVAFRSRSGRVPVAFRSRSGRVPVAYAVKKVSVENPGLVRYWNLQVRLGYSF